MMELLKLTVEIILHVNKACYGLCFFWIFAGVCMLIVATVGVV